MVMRAEPHTEDFLRLVIDTIPTMAWSLGPEGIVDFVNQRWVDYTGLTLEQELEEPTRPMHPDDLPRVMEKWRADIAAGEACEDEMRLQRADGEYRWFLIRTAPLRDERGKIIKWYGAAIDIEDRKQAEMKSRALIDAIPQQIWSAPPDGNTDYCNERWRSYTGIELKDLRGYGWKSMIHPEDRDRVLKAWKQSVTNGTPYEQEERHRGADGNYRWFLSLALPMRDAEGRIVRWYGTNTDIEDRKRAEEALRKSEKLFGAFMDHLPGFAWMKDIEGRYVWVNKKELELEVYRDGAIGKTDADLWPAEVASAYGANDQQVIATREALQTVEPSLLDGELSSMIVCKFPIFDQDGSVVMVAGAGVDITDRKRAEEALWDSLNLVRSITEETTDAIYAKDREGRYLMINTAGARFLGKSPEEVIGLDDTRLFSTETAATIIARDRSILESGETRTDEDISPGPSGVRIYLTTKGPLRDSSGAITGLFGVSRDITERKRADDLLRRSEEKFKTLFGIAPVGISVLDRQRNLVDSNPALEQITRLSREELLNGAWRRRTYLNPDGTPKLPGQLPTERAMAENRRINDLETGIVTENGEIIWVQVSVAPLTLPDASQVVITQDITERKRAAKKLEEANRQLRILSQQLFHIQEEERRHLARELHDEIGQTLTAAKINLKIIAPDVPAKVSSRLDDSIQLLDRLLRQVRQLSLDLRPPLLDELGLVPTLRWLVDQQAQRAGLRVTFTANVNGVELDPDVQTACFRVAQEAITNIIRHSGAKNVSVELRLEAGRLTLGVRDDGAGFDPAAMQESATLGLVSMKERASLAGGGLEVHSTSGRGTEIQAWFPLRRGEQPSGTKIQ